MLVPGKPRIPPTSPAAPDSDRPALWSSLLGRGELTLLDHARLQPPGDQSPGRERAEFAEEVLVVDTVKRRCQVRVEDPQSLRVRTLGDVQDRGDRVMTAPRRPRYPRQ